MATPSYSKSFYDRIREGSRRSASEILPLVLELVQPRSAVDVGCGLGTWLAVLQFLGVEDVVGVDGCYVDTKMLEISPERFRPFDLTQKLRLERTFDLVISLEVAEHLPPECASSLVESLTALGSVVLFSAAVPFQGGECHLNEQWPDYWASLFKAREFLAVDCLRERLWRNPNVEWWYAQNIMLFATRDSLDRNPLLSARREESTPDPLPLIHPQNYLAAADPRRMGLKKVLSALPSATLNSVRRRAGRSENK